MPFSFGGLRVAYRFILLLSTLSLSTIAAASTLSIAHRGNNNMAPENTLPAILAARGFADMIEIDVQPTADGQWVLMHDSTVNRTTNGQGAVSSLTLEQIRALDAGSWFGPQYLGVRVPTMGEAIGAILGNNMIPLVERQSGPIDQFVEALKATGATSQIIVHSYDWNSLGTIHALAPEIRLAALGDGNVTVDKLNQIQANGATIANWTKTNTIPPFLAMVHDRGMQMWSYVVNDQPTINSMVAMGVDGIGTDYPALVTQATQPASVVGRYIFYNNSKFDGGSKLPDANDKFAIAPNKTALLPGQTATFANYTSFNKGINGVILDVQNLSGLPTVTDFRFMVGNSDDVTQWSEAPAPDSITFRPNEGQNHSDRITIIWADGAIKNQWLEISLLPTVATGLAAADTFYFGSAVGESGNSITDARVSLADELIARNNPRSIANPTDILDRFDFNRDTRVSAIDQLLARNNLTTSATELRLIQPGIPLPPQALVPEPGSLALAESAATAVSISAIYSCVRLRFRRRS